MKKTVEDLDFGQKCQIVDENGSILVEKCYLSASCFDHVNDLIIYSMHGPFVSGVSTLIYSFFDRDVLSVE